MTSSSDNGWDEVEGKSDSDNDKSSDSEDSRNVELDTNAHGVKAHLHKRDAKPTVQMLDWLALRREASKEFGPGVNAEVEELPLEPPTKRPRVQDVQQPIINDTDVEVPDVCDQATPAEPVNQVVVPAPSTHNEDWDCTNFNDGSGVKPQRLYVCENCRWCVSYESVDGTTECALCGCDLIHHIATVFDGEAGDSTASEYDSTETMDDSADCDNEEWQDEEQQDSDDCSDDT